MPGKHEIEALRYMHEWEPSSRMPTKHIVAQQTAPGVFNAFEWSPRRKDWQPWASVAAHASRRVMVDAMLKEVEWANLSIMDEPVDFKNYKGFAPAEFDHCVFCVAHTMLCPSGVPGGDGWTEVSVLANGTGRPLGGAPTKPNHTNAGPFFALGQLAERYRKVALPFERAALGYERAVRVPPILLRHDRVAREIVPKEGWGIFNRPDLMARQVDRELAIKAAFEAEQDRRMKAGEYQPPAEQLWTEIAIRMDREWGAMAA